MSNQQLQKMCRKSLSHKTFLANLGTFGKNTLRTPQKLPAPTPMDQGHYPVGKPSQKLGY